MKARVFFPFLVVAMALVFAYAVYAKPPQPAPETPGDTTDWQPATNPVEPVALIGGHDVTYWHRAAVARAHRIVSLHRVLAHTATVGEAINLACIAYGSCSTLWRRAFCESRLYRYAQNASGASGLFQFLPSTWRSTPYARFSIFSAYANSLAAGWMIRVGRGGEWVCR